MNKKGIAPIIIVLIIALLAIGGIIEYTLIKNRSSYKDTTTTISSTTVTLEPTTTITTKSAQTSNILYKTTYDDGTLISRLYKSIDGGKH
ncbi:hypothetical protein, partial [Caldisericum sp.]|uniref:hypothetical protein n=1 Tax=Caldisericum sp. TaxID=2499687 RepID=UPI003D114EDF